MFFTRNNIPGPHLMTGKPKPPAKPAPKPPAPRSAPAIPDALARKDSRWQRTVRYGWDKGGSRGGR